MVIDDGQFVFEAMGIIQYLEARLPETPRNAEHRELFCPACGSLVALPP